MTDDDSHELFRRLREVEMTLSEHLGKCNERAVRIEDKLNEICDKVTQSKAAARSADDKITRTLDEHTERLNITDGRMVGWGDAKVVVMGVIAFVSAAVAVVSLFV